MAEARQRSRREIQLPRAEIGRPQGSKRTPNAAVSKNESEHIRILREFTETKQLDDPFQSYRSGQSTRSRFDIVDPPYNLASLLRQPMENNMLRQCIDALVTNVEGHGFRLEYVGPEGEEESDGALDEKNSIIQFLNFPNDDHSFQELRERLRRDLETTGNGYLEIGRDAQGKVVMMAHVPSHTMRLTTKEPESVNITVQLPRGDDFVIMNVRKNFRRFVQVVGMREVYFKEFGDPRTINPENGEADDEISLEEAATEIYHFKLYHAGSPYGMPRWVNQLPAILGSRQAELTNLDFFKENAIPAMALLVSGGMVTQSTIDDIEQHFANQRGRRAQNRIVIMEAEGDRTAASADGSIPPPKVEMKPLHHDRQNDALFQNYDEQNMRKVRSSFRLPPLFVGLSEDFSHATARAAYDVAESQVFGPERKRTDDMMNMRILATHQPKFWEFRTNPPRLTEQQTVLDALQVFEDVGALTPNVTIGLANEMFDLKMPTIKEDWGDFPFALVRTLASKGRLKGIEDIEKEPEPQDEPIIDDPDDTQSQQDLQNEIEEGQGGDQSTPDNLAKTARVRRRSEVFKNASTNRR